MFSRVLSAAMVAAEEHRDQRRKDEYKAPYINHPLKVAELIAMHVKLDDAKYLEDVLIAALLHDVVEDTSMTLDIIEKKFGSRVRTFVQEVSDDKSLPKSERKRLQMNAIQLRSPGAQMIKIADKISNCMDLKSSIPEGWSLLRAQGYFAWSRALVLNIPNIPELQSLRDYALYQCLSGGFKYKGDIKLCVPVDDSQLKQFVDDYLESFEN